MKIGGQISGQIMQREIRRGRQADSIMVRRPNSDTATVKSDRERLNVSSLRDGFPCGVADIAECRERVSIGLQYSQELSAEQLKSRVKEFNRNGDRAYGSTFSVCSAMDKFHNSNFFLLILG